MFNPKDTEIINLYKSGKTYMEIAALLGVSKSTVGNIVKNYNEQQIVNDLKKTESDAIERMEKMRRIKMTLSAGDTVVVDGKIEVVTGIYPHFIMIGRRAVQYGDIQSVL